MTFTPELEPQQVSPSSIDLRLGYQFTVFEPQQSGFTVSVELRPGINIEAGIEQYSKTIILGEGEPFTLHQGQFVLAYTLETITLSNRLAARVEGRSSVGRVGLSIHQTAPTVHATFSGALRLEMLNNGPFSCKLYPGTPICQLIVEHLGRPSTSQLRSQFQGQSPR